MKKVSIRKRLRARQILVGVGLETVVSHLRTRSTLYLLVNTPSPLFIYERGLHIGVSRRIIIM